MTCDLCGATPPTTHVLDPGPQIVDSPSGHVLDGTAWALCAECVEELLLNTGTQQVVARAVANIHDPANGPASAQALQVQIAQIFAALRNAYDQGAQFAQAPK